MLDVKIDGRIGSLDIAVSFQAGSGVTALVGPSGAGKSSVLRAISGLWTPEQGRITLGEKVLLDTSRGINLPPQQRRIGAVFQRPLLFPHMSVERNLAYGMNADHTGLEDMVSLLDLGAFLKRMPRNLSGGEAQRVSLGRALLSAPELLLLDEPMTGLDDERRMMILPYLQSLREKLATPILYVTHRRDEVAMLAQQVLQMEAGRGNVVLPVADYAGLEDRVQAGQG